MNSITPKQKAMFLMVVTALMWSIGGIFIKLIAWHPMLIAGVRSMISGAVLGGYMIYKGVRFKACKASFGAALGLGLSAMLFVIANKLTTAANAVVLQYSAPIFILIISAVFLHHRLKRREVVAVTITMIGIVLFFFDQLSPGNITGNILAILAGIFLALMFVSMGEGGSDDSIRMSGILMAHALVMFVGVPVGSIFTDFGAVTSHEILYIIILGVFQLGIPYVIYSIASRDCPPLACSLIGMLEPLLNPVWVLIFVGEIPGMFSLVGAAIIISVVTWWCIVENRQ